jgi:hypothetical protein
MVNNRFGNRVKYSWLEQTVLLHPFKAHYCLHHLFQIMCCDATPHLVRRQKPNESCLSIRMLNVDWISRISTMNSSHYNQVNVHETTNNATMQTWMTCTNSVRGGRNFVLVLDLQSPAVQHQPSAAPSIDASMDEIIYENI